MDLVGGAVDQVVWVLEKCGIDPPGGDSARIHQQADALQVFADRTLDIHRRLDGQVRQLIHQDWQGAASEAFLVEWEHHFDQVKKVSAQMNETAAWMHDHASTFESILREIIGIALEILIIWQTGMLLTAVTAGISDLVAAGRAGFLIMRVVALVTRVKNLCETAAAALRTARIGGAAMSWTFRKLVIDYVPGVTRYAGEGVVGGSYSTVLSGQELTMERVRTLVLCNFIGIGTGFAMGDIQTALSRHFVSGAKFRSFFTKEDPTTFFHPDKMWKLEQAAASRETASAATRPGRTGPEALTVRASALGQDYTRMEAAAARLEEDLVRMDARLSRLEAELGATPGVSGALTRSAEPPLRQATPVTTGNTADTVAAAEPFRLKNLRLAVYDHLMRDVFNSAFINLEINLMLNDWSELSAKNLLIDSTIGGPMFGVREFGRHTVHAGDSSTLPAHPDGIWRDPAAPADRVGAPLTPGGVFRSYRDFLFAQVKLPPRFEAVGWQYAYLPRLGFFPAAHRNSPLGVDAHQRWYAEAPLGAANNAMEGVLTTAIKEHLKTGSVTPVFGDGGVAEFRSETSSLAWEPEPDSTDTEDAEGEQSQVYAPRLGSPPGGR